MQSAVQRIAEPVGLAFAVTSRGTEPATLGETTSVALRLVQEALNYVVHHADRGEEAQQVELCGASPSR